MAEPTEHPTTELQFQFGLYCGEVNADGVRHGIGELRYNNGNHVKGTWVCGALTGEATKTFKNGDSYTGGFLNGAKHGHGTYRFRLGPSYTGDYKNDKQDGTGTWRGNNEHFHGSYVAGKRNGQGKEVASGNTYEGEWKDGEKHGQGRLTYGDGSYWEGRFAGGKATEEEGMRYTAEGERAELPEEKRAQPATTTTTASTSTAPLTDPVEAAVQKRAPVETTAAAAPLPLLPTDAANPMQADLLQAFAGMNAFGDNLTAGLTRATSGLDALESQLNELSKVLGDDFVEGNPEADLEGLGDLGAFEAELKAMEDKI